MTNNDKVAWSRTVPTEKTPHATLSVTIVAPPAVLSKVYYGIPLTPYELQQCCIIKEA